MKILLKTLIILAFLFLYSYSEAGEKVVFENFSAGYLDPKKWNTQPSSREIINSKLVKHISVRNGNYDLETEFLNPKQINSFECEISIDSVSVDTGNNTQALAYLGGFFYNADGSGTGAKGDIWADIKIIYDEQGLSVRYHISQVEDDQTSCQTPIYNNETLIPPGNIQPNTTYQIGISYDGENQFTFWITGSESDESASITVSGPDRARSQVTLNKGIYIGARSDSGAGQTEITISVDDVKTGITSTPYDSFDSQYLDGAKWDYFSVSSKSVIENEALLMETKGYNTSSGGKTFDTINELKTEDAEYIEAKMQVFSSSGIKYNQSNAALATARIEGYFYNETYNGNYNGYEDNIWVALRLNLLPNDKIVAQAKAWRSNEDETVLSSVSGFRYVFQTPITFNTRHTLSIHFDGKTFKFTVDDETWHYTPSGNVFKPYGECRWISNRLWTRPGDQAVMTVLVDDIFVDSEAAAKVNNNPFAPSLLYPEDSAADVSLTTNLAIDDFSDPDVSDTHAKTQWQISTESDFSDIILSEVSTIHLTSLPVPHTALEENRAYYWRARIEDNNANPSEWSEHFSFTTIDVQDDQDDNGIPDLLENKTVDLDSNGIADSLQRDIKSLNTIIGNKQIGISIKDSVNVTAIESINSIDPGTISEEKRPQFMPLGLFTFRLNVKNPGDTAEATIYFSEPAPESAVWYYYDTINGWSDYSNYAVFGNNRESVTVRLKDGDYGDADGAANGVIVDPSGFGVASWIKGFVTDALTNKAISNATISIKDMGLSFKCLSNGTFVSMILPGTYNLDVSAPGYQSQTISNVQIAEAAVVTQDAALTPDSGGGTSGSGTVGSISPECAVKIQGISLSQAPVVDTPVTITANAKDSCSKTIYYRFSVHPDYGTDDYDGTKWSLMNSTEYSTSNFIQYTFESEGKYVVVVWAVTDPHDIETRSVPVVGYSVDVTGTECKTDILGCTITGTQKAFRSNRLTANASSSCSKELYYRFSVHPYYGTSKYDGLRWEKMTDTQWTADNYIDYTFTQAGKHIVVVWVTDDPESYDPNGISIVGWSVDIE